MYGGYPATLIHYHNKKLQGSSEFLASKDVVSGKPEALFRSGYQADPLTTMRIPFCGQCKCHSNCKCKSHTYRRVQISEMVQYLRKMPSVGYAGLSIRTATRNFENETPCAVLPTIITEAFDTITSLAYRVCDLLDLPDFQVVWVKGSRTYCDRAVQISEITLG